MALCGCGCGADAGVYKVTVKVKGIVAGQPRLFIHGHNPRRRGPSYEVDASGCWLWLGAINSDGYGRMRDPRTSYGRMMQAHRFFYEQVRSPIPEGLQLDHLCRVRRCVNPEHLEPVTSRENVRRGLLRKLTPSDVTEIRTLGDSKTHSAIATKFGVSRRLVGMILQGQRWA